jgi:hypothetical protein
VRTERECLPCFVRQVSRTLGFAGVNGDRGARITRQAEAVIAQASLDQAPARISTLLHRLVREAAGVDPYLGVKREYNRIALEMLPSVRLLAGTAAAAPGGAADGLTGGVRAAIAGNAIDFGIYDRIDLDGSVRESFRMPLPVHGYAEFLRAVERSSTILYLCDNAGEIAFDRVLIDALRTRGKRVTAAVKGVAVINDATRADADAVSLADSADRIIDNGNDGIGTLLEQCSETFLDVYRSSDLIISKGQANYETLADERDERTFFLFKVKCPVVARWLGKAEGAIMLMGSGEAPR